LWIKVMNGNDTAQAYVGVTRGKDQRYATTLTQQGFDRMTHVMLTDSAGEDLYCAVWTKRNSQDQPAFQVHIGPESKFRSDLYPGLLLTDVHIGQTPMSCGLEERFRSLRAEAEEILSSTPDDLAAWRDKAEASYRLAENERALTELGGLLERSKDKRWAYLTRAIVHARLGKANEARADLKKFSESRSDPSYVAAADTIVSAFLGEDVEGMKRLESVIGDNSQDSYFLYNAACAYSQASLAFVRSDVTKARAYAERAVDLLEKAVSLGFSGFQRMREDSDLAPLQDHPRFAAVSQREPSARRQTAVWNANSEFTSTGLHRLGTKEQVEHAERLIAQGYRPISFSVAESNEDSSMVSASVWHRPVVPDPQREALAKQQANAAIALLRLDAPHRAVSLMKHGSDSRHRSYLIHRLNPFGADPQSVIRHLEMESDVSARRAWILALGEFAEDRQSREQRQSLIPQL
jgi:hypothetical protein